MPKFVKLYQEGGTPILPFVTYEPSPKTPASKATSGSSSDLTDKDLLDMLDKLDGLPSDMSEIVVKLKNFNLGYHGGPPSLAHNTRNITSRYIDILNDIKVANFNKKEYDNAYKKASKNGSLEEVAVNDRGQLVCQNAEGNFEWFTPEEFKEKIGEYYALTNSELLYYRAQDSSLANDNRVLSVVQNGVSMSVLNEYVEKAISGLGSEEVSNEGYFGNNSGKLIKGLQDYLDATSKASQDAHFDGTIEDLYKYKYLTEDQARNADMAINYIYGTLPENLRSLLKIKSDCTDEGALNLLEGFISSKVSQKQHFDVDMINEKSLSGATSGTNAAGLKDTQLVDFVKNINGSKQMVTIDPGNGIEMQLMGRAFNLVYDTNDKYIGNTSLSNMLSASGIQNLVTNMQNITFGDQKIDPDMLDCFTYNNTGVVRCNLPINPDGTVNLAILEQYERCEKQIEDLGHEPSPQEMQEIFAKEGLDNLLKANGALNEQMFAPFLVTQGYTTDALSGIKESKYVKKLHGDGKDKQVAKLIEASLYNGTDINSKIKVDTLEWWNPGDWFGLYDKIYRAAIYIPITDNVAIAARTDNQNYTYAEALEEKKKQDDAPKVRAYDPSMSSPSILDNNE